MRDLGERVRLVHELRKLTATKELVNCPSHRLGVYNVMQHHRFRVLQRHALLDRAFHPHQTNPELRFQQFANATHPAVAEMVNIVNETLWIPFLEFQQVLHGQQNILMCQDQLLKGVVLSQFLVDLEAAHFGEAVALFIEEEVLKHRLRGFQGRWIARFHLFVNLDERLFWGGDLVQLHCCPEARPNQLRSHVQHLKLADALFQQRVQ